MSVLNYFIQQASQKGFVIEAVKMIIASLVPALLQEFQQERNLGLMFFMLLSNASRWSGNVLQVA